MKTSSASQVVAAMLGLAGPVAVGVMTGHAQIGVLASLGGLALSGAGKDETFREQAPSLIYTLIAASAAILMGSVMAGRDLLTIFGIPVIAAVVGLFGGISRPLARASTQFILFTIIAASLGGTETHPFIKMLLFFLGAAWTAVLSLALRPLFQTMHSAPVPNSAIGITQTPKPSIKQLLHRWWNSLSHFSGWQYTLRITSCLAAAGAFEWIWPNHHGYWVSITVAIVVHRNLQVALPRALQRAAGTVFGVLIISLLLLASPPVWAMIAAIAILAMFRPILMEVNYSLYAAVMTPLIILLLDFGQAPSWMAVIDRLVATLIGCTLALTLGYLLWFKFSPAIRVAVEKVNRPFIDSQDKFP